MAQVIPGSYGWIYQAIKNFPVNKLQDVLKQNGIEAQKASSIANTINNHLQLIIQEIDFSQYSDLPSFNSLKDSIETVDQGSPISRIKFAPFVFLKIIGKLLVEIEIKNRKPIQQFQLYLMYLKKICTDCEYNEMNQMYPLWALYFELTVSFPQQLISEQLTNDVIQISRSIESENQKRTNLDKTNQDIETRQKEIETKLNDLASETNFIELYSGFKEAHTRKKNELRATQVIMTLLVLAILGFAGYSINKNLDIQSEKNTHAALIYSHLKMEDRIDKKIADDLNQLAQVQFNQFTVNDLFRYLTFFSIEIILIYFLRINLKSFFSIKGQLLQLDLRMSVCKFIYEYPNFKSKHKDIDLEAFEKLIFSGITTESDKIPATFDGLNSLANIINTMNKK